MGLYATIIDGLIAGLSANEKATAIAVNTTNYNSLRTEQNDVIGGNEDPRPLFGEISVLVDDTLPTTGATAVKVTRENIASETFNITLS